YELEGENLRPAAFIVNSIARRIGFGTSVPPRRWDTAGLCAELDFSGNLPDGLARATTRRIDTGARTAGTPDAGRRIAHVRRQTSRPPAHARRARRRRRPLSPRPVPAPGPPRLRAVLEAGDAGPSRLHGIHDQRPVHLLARLRRRSALHVRRRLDPAH